MIWCRHLQHHSRHRKQLAVASVWIGQLCFYKKLPRLQFSHQLSMVALISLSTSDYLCEIQSAGQRPAPAPWADPQLAGPAMGQYSYKSILSPYLPPKVTMLVLGCWTTKIDCQRAGKYVFFLVILIQFGKYTPLLMSPVGGGGAHILILTVVVFINSPGAWQI